MEVTEKILVQQLLQQNRHAQKKLYSMYAPKMLAVCKYYIQDNHYAEDVMINGFLKVFTKIDSYNFTGSFEGWIRKIMTRECLTFLKKEQHITYTESINHDDNIDLEEEALLSQEIIDKAISQLPTGYRTVLLLHIMEEYTHKKIASLLHISESTSKSQLFKAKKMLKELINTYKNEQ